MREKQSIATARIGGKHKAWL